MVRIENKSIRLILNFFANLILNEIASIFYPDHPVILLYFLSDIGNLWIN